MFRTPRFQMSAITRRWMYNTFGVIVAILAIVAIASCLVLHRYYYSIVEMNLNQISESLVSSYFSVYLGSDEKHFEAGARGYVESFEEKDTMEVWVLDSNGNVIVSSSGFDIPSGSEMPDYVSALENSQSKHIAVCRTPSGEKVMARTILISGSNRNSAGAVRYLTSLEQIDDNLAVIDTIICVACVFGMFLVWISGYFFIQSIVKPVRKVSKTAQDIAKGNFAARIDSHRYNDEIGELCETINYMAGELEDSEKIKNDFISTVSHELRTPLTAIQGWAETLAQTEITDPNVFRKGMKAIVSESERLSSLVEDLLDFSRIQSGRMNMKREKIDVLAELDDTMYVFKERALREGVDLEYNAPTLPAPMEGDGDRIKQAFVNILDNAIKYTGQGGKVNVTAAIAPEEGKLTITFADNGCGIPAHDLPRVKEKFYKANTSVRGSGIGLAVTDEIIRRHGGTLDISSVEGEGTTVTVTLPIEQAQLLQVPPAELTEQEEREVLLLEQIVKEQQSNTERDK